MKLENLAFVSSQEVQLTVSWENSWNTPSQAPFNHDAVWLFLKYRNGTSWQHLNLSTVSGDHQSQDSSLSITATADGKGLFLKRLVEGAGNIINAAITIKLQQGLASGTYDLAAYGIEMVWINEGEFFVGDSISNNSLRNALTKGPFRITSEALIPVANSGNSLDNSISHPPANSIPSSFPKGYSGFYAMKYEVSQEQYVAFLNTLSYQQQASRSNSPSSAAGTFVLTPTQQPANRNAVIITTSGNSTNPAEFGVNGNGNSSFNDTSDAQNRACNYLSWQDLAAYLDWACLSPMTELEYEKICRGEEYPVQLEFAWGTANVSDANTIQFDGTKSETATEKGDSNTGVASHGYNGPQGPIRCGFNGTAQSTRLETGASYYGCMEMSGNLWEQCIGLSMAGLNFTGNNGDGALDANGNADVSGWDLSGNAVSVRGGGWNSGIQGTFRDLAVSDRFYGFMNTSNRRNTTGGRGVRRL